MSAPLRETTEDLQVEEPSAAVLTSDVVAQPSLEAPLDSLKPGDIVAGKYEIVGLVGQGGLGSVYKVRHTIMEKFLALKVLHNEKISGRTLMRFARESKLISRLNHPNIVKVHDFGTTAIGHAYMVMEFIEGQSLSTFIKTGNLSATDLIRIYSQICHALEHAHEKGIVHRDIKPSNVIIVSDESGEFSVKVIDFGIAKIVGDDDVKVDNDLTRTGDVVGTPQYMSPEQCMGRAIDERSDIYSFGCLMYEGLVGSPPFTGESTYDIVHKQINQAPAGFPARLRATREGRRLEAVILKCLAKQAEERYRYVVQVASDLKQSDCKHGGVFAECKDFFKILSRRSRAVHRQTLVELWTLRTLSICAIVISVALCALPPVIGGLLSEQARCGKLIYILNQMVNAESASGAEYTSANDKARFVAPLLSEGFRLTEGDPVLHEQMEQWSVAVSRTVSLAKRLERTVLLSALGNRVSLSMMGHLHQELPAFDKALVNAHIVAIGIRTSVLERRHIVNDELFWRSVFLLLAASLVVPVEASIAVFLGLRASRRAKEKSDAAAQRALATVSSAGS